MVGEINNIIVIESLGAERKTGNELYNDCIRRQIEYRQSKISHNFYDVQNRDNFIELIKYYQANSPYIQGGILLHLEMHGDKDAGGLRFADNSLILWSELVNLLRPINVNTCNNLYVSLATCDGRFMYLGVDPNLKSPYSCYISASETVKPSEIIDQYLPLFEELIRHGNLVKAYLDSENKDSKFYYKDSETIFEEAYQVTAARWKTENSIKEEVMKEAEEEIKRQRLKMPNDAEFDFIMNLALKHTYERYKKALDFSDCKLTSSQKTDPL